MKKLLLIGLLSAATCIAAQATSITGGISFTGGYTPENAGGTSVTDLNLAKKIAFGTTVVAPAGTSGSFTVIPDLTPVAMFSPLVISPATLPGSALWTVTSGANSFSFTLTSMVVSPVSGTAPGVQALTVSGVGMMAYTGGLGYTPTVGTFIATFNAGGGTFSWSASSAVAPDGGSTVALLGTALLGLAGLRRKIAKVAGI